MSSWLLPYVALITWWLTVASLRCPGRHGGDAPSGWQGHWWQAVAVGAVPILLYWRVTNGWWLHDDPSILRHVLEYPGWANLYDPLVWRAYSPANFTPLLPLSFWLDLELFGLTPRPFYLHQLAAVGAAAALGYLLLVRFLTPVVALLVVLLVVRSPAVAELAESLMTRHYLEGLVALLAALLAGSHGIATGRRGWIWLSAAGYLIACLAKEVFVPAILLFPFLLAARRDWRAWWPLAPVAACALLYALWRLWMLGAANLLAGYGDLHAATDPADWAERVLALLARLGLGHWLQGPLLVALAAVACWSLARRREGRMAGVLLFGLIAAWAPLLPLFPDIASRSLLLPTIWLAVVAGLGVQRLLVEWRPCPRWAARVPALSAAVLVLSLALAGAGWAPRADATRARAEWDFIMQADPEATLVWPQGEPWYYTSLGWLRRHLGDGRDGPAVCYSPCLCAATPGRAYYRFASGGVERDAPQVDACPRLLDVPLAVALHYDAAAGVLQWELSPARAGRWFYARVPMFRRAPIPRRGTTPYLLKQAVDLQFFFESESGWAAGSAVLRLDPARVGDDRALRLIWSRGP